MQLQREIQGYGQNEQAETNQTEAETFFTAERIAKADGTAINGQRFDIAETHTHTHTCKMGCKETTASSRDQTAGACLKASLWPLNR